MTGLGRARMVALGVVLMTLPGFAEVAEVETEPGLRGVAPKVQEVFRKVSDYYAGLDRFQVEMRTSMRMTAPQGTRTLNTTLKVAVARPNRLSLGLKSARFAASVICDGERLYTYVPALAQYIAVEAPEQLGDVLSASQLNVTGDMGLRFVNLLLQKSPYEVMLSGVYDGQYAGTEDIRGVPCHHLKLFSEELEWDGWVEEGERPLITEIAPAMMKLAARSQNLPPGASIEATVAFDNWEPNADLPEEQFAFNPPPDAEKVDSFAVAAAGKSPEDLLGKLAPQFTLELLDGGTLDLAVHNGKNVVILDFWATWCGPCRQAMPIITRVAEEYRSKDVVLYAVNVRETPGAIRAFLDSLGLKPLVALDKDGRVADRYAVQGIPTTVIVGKDGTVQAVHVGVAPDLGRRLKKELDALVAGETLAAPSR